MHPKILINGLTSLPSRIVRTILLVTDTSMISIALYISYILMYGDNASAPQEGLLLSLATILPIGAIIIFSLRLHQIKLVMLNSSDILNIARASIAVATVFFVQALFLHFNRPFGATITFGTFLFAGMVLSRSLAIAVLRNHRGHLRKRKAIAIFGAGTAGVTLASTLTKSTDIRVLAFFDDNPTMQGVDIGGIPVLPPSDLIEEMSCSHISEVIVALPDTARDRRRAIVEKCTKAGIEVRILPSVIELLAERRASKLETVLPHDVLGRSNVELDVPEVEKSYSGRVVMVTGAGGSIGSELCRQLLNCQPAKIVLFENSEFNLYTVHQKLRTHAEKHGIPIVALLGSITNSARVRNVIRSEGVEIIVHAAAYKHVPLLEGNEIEGARNNVLGTKVLVDAAAQEGVKRFILVSSDKAVRPKSVMGATKRIAELIVQDVQVRFPNTKFSMVRFGNVLGSSGSVLPLFLSQIEAGGPITVTHPDMRRYFMTVKEASRLVLLAGAYSQGGDVFVLDMGKPQKIINLARKLVQLSGRRVLDPKTGQGDIEIKITGLRPGEKLHEELFVNSASLRKTPHKKIFRAEEEKLSEIEVAGLLREVIQAIELGNTEMLRRALSDRVEGNELGSAM